MKRIICAIIPFFIIFLIGCGETQTDRYLTDPVPEGHPEPVEPQDAVIEDAEYVCTISIVCASLLDESGEVISALDAEKRELVPEDGYILPPTEVIFYGGESVFNLLTRVCRQNQIHLEFTDTPLYNSAYIEGIGNLYEFDAGELSGWIYSVNGWQPNYGCSRYALHEGDSVVWEYALEPQFNQFGGGGVPPQADVK